MEETPQILTQTGKKKPRVLAIDDNADFLDLLRFRFLRENVEYITCHDGESGLIKAREVIPDLILVDIKMPRMDGFQFVQELKKDPSTSKIPVIVLTSFEPMRDIFGLEGIQDYIIKSNDMTSLWNTVSKYLS